MISEKSLNCSMISLPAISQNLPGCGPEFYGPNGGQLFGNHIVKTMENQFAPIDVPKECTSIGNSKFVHVGLCSVVDLERIIILKVFVNFSVNLTIVWVRPPLQAPAIHMGWKFKLRIS